jgi:hypothetical protein
MIFIDSPRFHLANNSPVARFGRWRCVWAETNVAPCGSFPAGWTRCPEDSVGTWCVVFFSGNPWLAIFREWFDLEKISLETWLIGWNSLYMLICIIHIYIIMVSLRMWSIKRGWHSQNWLLQTIGFLWKRPVWWILGPQIFSCKSYINA